MADPSDASSMRSRARVGLVLREKWRIEGIIGVGGMAVVYTATHINNGRRVAIKLLHPELSLNAELRTRFLREGYVANKINHKGAVSILDDDVADDGAVFLVLELLEGETIEARRIRMGGRLPPGEILSISDKVLDVLIAAHEAGVVHRDVKPDNIFLTKDGGVKLLDFGIARVRELQSRQATMTGSGAMGTPAFMPNEQARGRWELVGPRTDIWALGATMFTLATGRCVHVADTVNEVLLAAMTKQPQATATVEPGLPPAFTGLVDRALAYDIEGRWADARGMQAALRSAYPMLDDGPATYRGVGGAGGTVPFIDGHGVPDSALSTGPRPPPSSTFTMAPRPPPEAPPPAAPQHAPQVLGHFAPAPYPGHAQHARPMDAEAQRAGASPLQQPSQQSSQHPFAPPRGVAGAGPQVASHATAHAVAIASERQARARGAGVVLVVASLVSLGGAYGVYRLFTGGGAEPSPAASAAASASTQPAPQPPAPVVAPPTTSVPAPVAAAAPSADPSNEPAPSAEPSAAPSASAVAPPAPVRKHPTEGTKPKKDHDLLNRRK
jgi:serine/threonine-protein kinase